ncbi:hypothetical protein HPB47_000359 [Ixodes persulcatus]|uniref:Uncharacterized protein n=1 Tax=Ixodes persulcatus TaxID=34615 RepID=A0AC60PSN6_IXOPE|nr:hypothetical protein HPB47_000359 [Ixodes persulcatus]
MYKYIHQVRTGALVTRKRRQELFADDDVTCRLCGLGDEDIDHIFSQCPCLKPTKRAGRALDQPPKQDSKKKTDTKGTAKKKEGSSSGGKAKKKKWSKGKVRDKLNNLVLFDKATYDKLLKEVPSYKLITPSVVSERLKVRGSLARKALDELLQKGASGSPSAAAVSSLGPDPEHMTALLGQDVILHCPFEYPDGLPVPYLVQWHKKDHKIPIYIWYDGYPPHAADDYKERISLSGQSSLNLTSVRETDKGWYECKVFFLNRETIRNGTWIYLDVLAPPHFKAKPEQVIYVKVGESVVLPCEAEGTPPPTIIWYKDNLPLEEGSSVQIHPTELRISNLRQTDVGDYMCMARNSEGSDTAVSKVIVAGPAVITTPPQNLTKLEGNFAEFVCEARALPSNITHRWFYNGVEISKLTWLQTRTLVRQDGTLFINPTAADDSGFYTCEISNGIGNPESATAYLNIEYPARVNFTPAFQYMPLNLSGIVRCYIQANPAIQFVTWFKDNRPFEASSVNGVVNLSNGSLFFQRVSYEHQGRYLCSPFNIHSTGGSSAVMEVLVREPPMFSVKPKELYQQPRNTEVTMPCEGKGHPPPSVSWRRADGKKLPKNRHAVNKGKLTIRSLQKEDHGRYECVLQNDVATLVTSTLLLVESTTPHAPTNVSVNTSAFAATVSWLPGYDGGHPQTYVLWYRLVGQGDAEWRTIRVYPDNAITLTIHNLQPESQYEFQVLSRNAFGDGLYSDIVRANTSKWNYIEGAYPTDAYGSTYIPTVNRTPTGPKPSAPRNVTVRETPAGVLVTWVPPPNSSVPIAFYCVEYRSPDKPWARSTNIMTGSEYTITDLPEGTKFYIRVSAFSITSAFEPSPEILLTLAGLNDVLKGRSQNLARQIEVGLRKLREVSETVHVEICTVPEVRGQSLQIERRVVEANRVIRGLSRRFGYGVMEVNRVVYEARSNPFTWGIHYSGITGSTVGDRIGRHIVHFLGGPGALRVPV